MADLADLYPGFASEWVSTSRGRIFARIGGSGPPLLLLHGYPQTHVMWHRVAPQLAARFQLVIADLPGYGWSDVPKTDADHTPFSKRGMAEAMIEVMEKLGHARFALAGHDRGARVSYRLALDHPGRLSRLAVLDILPTLDYWAKMDRAFALRVYHWAFLAQPAPLPEHLIAANSDEYFTHTLKSWARSGTDPFDPRALQHYLAALRDPLRIHAACEDYRAGATTDVAHDEADRDAGRMISTPLLALWGGAGIAASAATPLDTWRRWATNVSGAAIESSGHFLCEEQPETTAAALLAFFSA